MANDGKTPGARSTAGLGPVAYIAAAIIVLSLAVYGYLRFAASGSTKEDALTPEGKAYVRNLQLNGVEMKSTGNYMNQRVVEIQGQIANAGDRSVETVDIYCVFRDPYGQLVLRKRMPIVSSRMGGLKPAETKSFRLAFDEIPDSWNQAMPQLVIASVKFS